MRRVVVTTVVRRAGVGEASGYLQLVDLEDGRSLGRTPLPDSVRRRRDPNPRGGLRGARGVDVHGDRLVVASADRVFVLDRRWRIRKEISHPLLGGIHHILATDNGVWVASTSADLLVRMDWDGGVDEVWEWRRDADLRRALGYPRVPRVDRHRDYRDPASARYGVPNLVHLNSVVSVADVLLVCLGRVTLPGEPRESTYGICPVPESFGELPAELTAAASVSS